MLENGNAEVAVALGLEIVEDCAVVCARHADGLLREEAAVGERGHCVAVLLQNLAEQGIACFPQVKIPSALYRKSVQNNSSYKYL